MSHIVRFDDLDFCGLFRVIAFSISLACCDSLFFLRFVDEMLFSS